MYGFYDTWTRPIWSGTRDQMKPTVPKNGICKWRRQNKSKAKLGRRKPCCSHNKSRQPEQLCGYMYIPIVITTTIDSWPTKLSQDCWPFCRWSVRQNVVFFVFLSCLRLLLGHSLYSPKEKRQNRQELDKIMRKITMHRNLCRLRDRSNRELCISGCRLRLHNHFVSVYGSTRYVSKEITSNWFEVWCRLQLFRILNWNFNCNWKSSLEFIMLLNFISRAPFLLHFNKNPVERTIEMQPIPFTTTEFYPPLAF